MKWIKLFEEFGKDAPMHIGVFPGKEINREEFKQILQENCKDFLETLEAVDYNLLETQNFLFRSSNENVGNFVYTNPGQSPTDRIAPFSRFGNYHNLVISNLDSWSEYPKRNKSLITAGWKRVKKHAMGHTYLIIPFDSVKIAECGGDDFWEAFKSYMINGVSVNLFFNHIIEIVSKENDGVQLSDTDWSQLKPYLDKKYPKELFDEVGYYKKPLFKERGIDSPSIYDESKTLLENIDDYLSPEYNNFRLKDYKTLMGFQFAPNLRFSGNECWFSGEGLMINWKFILNNFTEMTDNTSPYLSPSVRRRRRVRVLDKEGIKSLFI
jgi:hypothetical protein